MSLQGRFSSLQILHIVWISRSHFSLRMILQGVCKRLHCKNNNRGTSSFAWGQDVRDASSPSPRRRRLRLREWGLLKAISWVNEELEEGRACKYSSSCFILLSVLVHNSKTNQHFESYTCCPHPENLSDRHRKQITCFPYYWICTLGGRRQANRSTRI